MRVYWLWLCIWLISSVVWAEEAIPTAVRNALLEELKKSEVVQVIPDTIAITSAKETDMYEAIIGAYVFRISKEGNLVIRGDLSSEEWEKLPTDQQKQIRVKALNTLQEKSMIVFASPHPKHTVTAFVDLDCSYSAKLHQEVALLSQADIQVRYLSFPSAKEGSPLHQRTVSVWCAQDPQLAFSEAIQGKSINVATCQHPLNAHYTLARSLGVVEGTPTLIFDDGELHLGYMSAVDIIAYFHLQDTQKRVKVPNKNNVESPQNKE